jgi:NitT/TauT family transport system permease protein
MTSVETRTDAAFPVPAATRAPPRRPSLFRFSAENTFAVQLSRILFGLFFLGLWELGADRLFDSFFFSTPLRIIAQVGRELADPAFYRDLGVTAFEMGLGFAIGAGSGIALGVLLARWAFAAKVLDPYLLALYSIPRIARLSRPWSL